MGDDNGKIKRVNSESVYVIDEATKQALLSTDNKNNIDSDPTKFTLLENISDDSKSDWFTHYRNYNEVLQMNDIESHARLLPVVFKSKSDSTVKHVQRIQEIFMLHVKDHQRNMSAYKKNQLLALVHAVRQDSSVVNTDKEVKKLFGGR